MNEEKLYKTILTWRSKKSKTTRGQFLIEAKVINLEDNYEKISVFECSGNTKREASLCVKNGGGNYYGDKY